ncbi:MAG TPA: pyridoxal 5'-phosphate synthase glutaminase subunit PdxT [Methanomicrobiales archaeon]|nr:pyridoxal 5'-phosphate synthase glutaminase subunit PdxT [Methanomicrobiales archaeon]
MDVRIGVLALQGDVSEHISAFRQALVHRGCGKAPRVIPIRTGGQIERCDALAIPGGESTTISRLIDRTGMRRAIEEFEGGIFATCAGMVLLSTDAGDPRVKPLGLLDMTVERNAFGRQKESFEADLALEGLRGPAYRGVFIRAPVVKRAGPGVQVISRIPEGIVAVRSGPHLALSFHPELTGDLRIHTLFLNGLLGEPGDNSTPQSTPLPRLWPDREKKVATMKE